MWLEKSESKLNALPNSNPMQEIYKTWTKADSTDQPTYPSNQPVKKIDYGV